MSDSDSTVDLLVFGGGMAGMSAAARACSEGASVILVEKGPGVGGSAMYAGFVWTAPTVDVMREVNPDADPELAGGSSGYGEALDWVRSLRVHVADRVTVLGYGRGSRPTWRTICWPATGSFASTTSGSWGGPRSGFCSRTEPSSLSCARLPRLHTPRDPDRACRR